MRNESSSNNSVFLLKFYGRYIFTVPCLSTYPGCLEKARKYPGLRRLSVYFSLFRLESLDYLIKSIIICRTSTHVHLVSLSKDFNRNPYRDKRTEKGETLRGLYGRRNRGRVSGGTVRLRERDN